GRSGELGGPAGAQNLHQCKRWCPGHAWIDIGCDGGIGKYPASKMDIFGGDAAYRVEQKSPDMTVEINTTAAQEATMIQSQLSEIKQNTTYNIANNNCVTHANRVAQSGGVGAQGGQGFTTPHDYIRTVNLQSGGGGDGMSISDGRQVTPMMQR
ncbi:MAG: hypothetical protein PQJ28_04535, partial [Spirochaetales bacterium]|nr:hypothetical protein [Spirochaetales bacterium]